MILKIKTIILTVLISIFYLTGYSQSERILTTEATGDKNIYNHAFRILLLNMESKINKINSEEINNYYRHLYLVKSIFTHRSLTNITNERIILVEGERNLKKILIKNGPIKVFEISPLKKKENFFYVEISFQRCYLSNNSVNYSLISASSVRYRFDSKLNNFILTNAK